MTAAINDGDVEELGNEVSEHRGKQQNAWGRQHRRHPFLQLMRTEVGEDGEVLAGSQILRCEFLSHPWWEGQ